MLGQLGESRVGAIARMTGDIGVDEISQDRPTPSIPTAHRNIDRLPLFDASGFGMRRSAATASFRLLRAGKIVMTSPSRVISRSMSVSA
jgi:hypothetical protein